MSNASRSDADAAKAPDASDLETELRETIEAIRGRRLAAEELGVRHTISRDEMEVLVRAAKAIRAAVDQNAAPPVDAELVRRAAWDQLPIALAEMVQGLALRYESWDDALMAEEDRRAAMQNAADSN